MTRKSIPVFVRCRHVDGTELFAWLGLTQAHTPAECWDDETVLAFEEAGSGQMVPREVRLADLSDMEET